MAHQVFCPVIVVRIGAGSHTHQRLARILSAIIRKSFVLRRIYIRRHPSAATPGFIADPPVCNMIGLDMTICLPQGSHITCTIVIAVLDPAFQLFGCSCAYISCEVGLATDQLTEMQELVSAKAVIFRY